MDNDRVLLPRHYFESLEKEYLLDEITKSSRLRRSGLYSGTYHDLLERSAKFYINEANKR